MYWRGASVRAESACSSASMQLVHQVVSAVLLTISCTLTLHHSDAETAATLLTKRSACAQLAAQPASRARPTACRVCHALRSSARRAYKRQALALTTIGARAIARAHAPAAASAHTAGPSVHPPTAGVSPAGAQAHRLTRPQSTRRTGARARRVCARVRTPANTVHQRSKPL